jgi:hypothetical protein
LHIFVHLGLVVGAVTVRCPMAPLSTLVPILHTVG